MNIHEHQAKKLLNLNKVNVARGMPAFSVNEALTAAKKLGGPTWVVKAQIHAGGRGKAGGVKVVNSLDEVKNAAEEILGKILVTPQTGAQGKEVKRLYIEEGCDIKKELYLSVLVDRNSGCITFIASTYELNVKNLEERNIGAIYTAAFFVAILVYGIAWSFWRTYKTENVLKEVVTETCITTSMVFIILLGAAMLTSGFRAFGGEELVRDFLQDLPGGFWIQFIVVMIVIFLLGFFLDFIEIAVVVVPIIAPILLAETGANVTAVWLGVMIGVNLQTSFLTPPFGFALFYLKGVAPKVVQTLDIWKGVVPFIILQLIGLGIVGAYPSLVNYLPNRVYLTSNVAPPPMNPKLQYCLQEYKFANYSNNADVINKSITDFDDIILANLPADKLSYFQRHVDNSKYSFELVNEVKSTETLYNDYAVDYRDLPVSYTHLTLPTNREV